VTQWVEYPDIAPLFKSLYLSIFYSLSEIQQRLAAAVLLRNVAPSVTNATPYAIPTLHFSSDEIIRDSKAIATRLEELYPSPSLNLSSASLKAVEDALADVVAALRGQLIAAIPSKLLNEASIEYFVRTRSERFGVRLDEMEKLKVGRLHGGQQKNH
jgi:hypothetical protein